MKAQSVYSLVLLIAILNAPTGSRAAGDTVQFCWAPGKSDQTVYFAEVANREDRQASFEQLLTISGIDHHPVRCHVLDASIHRGMRTHLLTSWLETEFEVVDTTFMSDLDY